MGRKIILILVAALVFLGVAQTSQSAVVVSRATPTGPVMIDPGNGFPVYYDDGTTQLVPCMTENPAAPTLNPYCVLLVDPFFDAVSTVIFPTNYPSEAFYFVADADTKVGLAPFVSVARFAIEGSFANTPTQPADGWQTTFARVRFVITAPAVGSYVITHPYGTVTLTSTAAGQLLRSTVDVPGGIPLDFAGLQAGQITSFLKCADCLPITDPAGNTYIGDPLVFHPVIGGPLRNTVTVTGPGIGGPGINLVTTNLFQVAGKVFNGSLPTALTIPRASYSRTVGNAVQVDVFADSDFGATVKYREAGSVVDVPMAFDVVNPLSSRFYGKSNPVAPPASVLVTATLVGGATTTIPANVTDYVTISKAQFNRVCNDLVINAASSDALPLPALTAVGFGNLIPGLSSTQSLTVRTIGATNVVPPAQIKVTSARGGSAVELVTVVPDTPPTANNDSAIATAGTVTTINVILNDTDAETAVDQATITIIPTLTTLGTATALPNGTVTYTPNPGPTRTDTFQYTVKDTACTPGGQIATSKPATVTILVTGVTGTPPTAGTIAVLMQSNTSKPINILSFVTKQTNTVSPASVAVVPGSGPLHGTIVSSGTGTLTYTPALNYSGLDSFHYTVADIGGLVSNPSGTVSITVIIAPTANAIAALTTSNTATTIDILASVTTGTNPLNQASVAVVAGSGPLHGVVSAPTATGTITYTPAPAYIGPDSFQYTVADTSGFVSNAATVSVTVNPPPGANPTAGPIAISTLSNTPKPINILASVITGSNTISGASVTVVAGSGPLHGSIVSSGTGTLTYTPSLNYIGLDSFQYTVADTFGLVSNPAGTVTITVLNTPPIAAIDTATTAQRTAVIINVLANDRDPDGTLVPSTVAIATAPSVASGGTVTINALTGAITYTPGITATGAFFSGADTFTYTVKDNLGAPSNAATVTVNVGATAEAIAINTAEIVRIGKIAAQWQWKINGSSTQRVANTMTLTLVRGAVGGLGGTTLGTIGTAAVGANGSWQFAATGGLGFTTLTNTPATGDIVRATSTFGTAAWRALAVK